MPIDSQAVQGEIYGKIEDLVVGLEVVLADGTTIRTGGQPRQAVGPDLTHLFVGAEGKMEMTKVPEAGYRIEALPIRGFQRHAPWRNITLPG